MIKNSNRVCVLLGVLAIALTSVAQTTSNAPKELNFDANRIELNGADWTLLREKAAATMRGDTADISVLHIGDSHIQAEFITCRLRELLQKRYGNAGRGLVAPLRLAGTNQSGDYTIHLAGGEAKIESQTRLLKLPWSEMPGLCGVAAKPSDGATVVVGCKGDGHGINHATLITSGRIMRQDYVTARDSVNFDVPCGESLWGAVLQGNRHGLLYSAIGNNGACYNDYLLIDDFAPQTSLMRPDLIILTMGTNEAFSMMSDEAIEVSVRTLLRELRRHNPNAAILMMTPMECHRDLNHPYYPRAGQYDINRRIAPVAQIIRRVAAETHTALWDFYAVAGGEGAADRWLDASLLNPRDHIHLLRPGYELAGDLLYQALVTALDWR